MRQHRLGPRQGGVAQIGVADRVEHDGVRRQLLCRIVEVGIKRDDREGPVVENILCRNVAAARRNRQQNRHRGRAAAIGLNNNRMPGKALLPMGFRGGGVTEFCQGPGQPLVRLVKLRLGRKRGLKLRSRTGEVVSFVKQIAEVDAPRGIARMMVHSLPVSRVRGGWGSLANASVPSSFSAAKWVASQYLQIGGLRLVIPSGRGEPARLREKCSDRIGHRRREPEVFRCICWLYLLSHASFELANRGQSASNPGGFRLGSAASPRGNRTPSRNFDKPNKNNR